MHKYVILLFITLLCFSCHKKKEVEKPKLYGHFQYDYEDIIKKGFPNSAYKGVSISGDYSNILDSQKQYGVLERKYISELTCPEFTEVSFQAWIYPFDSIMDGVFVFSIIDTSKNESKLWEGYEIDKQIHAPKNWFQVKGKILVSLNDRNPGDQIHFYFWNRDTTAFLVDDLEVNLCGDFETGNAFFYNLENNPEFEKSNTLTEEASYSGKTSSKISGKNSYSISIEKPITDVHDYKSASKVGLSCWLTSKEPVVDAVLVFSLVDTVTKTATNWQGKVIEDQNFSTEKWTKISAEFILPDSIKTTEKFQVYVWNRNGNTIFADDFYIVFKTFNEIDIEPYLDLTKGSYEEQKKINYPPFTMSYLFKQKDLTAAFQQNKIDPKTILASVSGKFEKVSENQTFILTSNRQLVHVDIENTLLTVYNANIEVDSFKSVVAFNVDEDQEDEIVIACKNAIITGDYNHTESKFSFRKISVEKDISLLTELGENLIVLTNEGLFSVHLNPDIKWQKLSHSQLNDERWKEFNIQLIAGNFVEKNHRSLFAVFSDSTNHFFKIIDIKNDAVTSVINGLTIGVDTLTSMNSYFVLDIDNDGLDELLKYNDTWRFDLKMLHFAGNHFIIESTVNFKGFENDLNPKFYENLNLYPIKLHKHKFGLLVHGFNSPGNQQHPYFDKVKDFPETIQFYAF